MKTLPTILFCTAVAMSACAGMPTATLTDSSGGAATVRSVAVHSGAEPSEVEHTEVEHSKREPTKPETSELIRPESEQVRSATPNQSTEPATKPAQEPPQAYAQISRQEAPQRPRQQLTPQEEFRLQLEAQYNIAQEIMLKGVATPPLVEEIPVNFEPDDLPTLVAIVN